MLAEDNSFSLYLLDAVFLDGEFTLLRIILIGSLLDGLTMSFSFYTGGLLNSTGSLSGKFYANSAYSDCGTFSFFFFFGTFYPPI